MVHGSRLMALGPGGLPTTSGFTLFRLTEYEKVHFSVVGAYKTKTLFILACPVDPFRCFICLSVFFPSIRSTHPSIQVIISIVWHSQDGS